MNLAMKRNVKKYSFVLGILFLILFSPIIVYNLEENISESQIKTYTFVHGSGSVNDPYIIEDIDDLDNIRNNLTAHYRLANDIDASETRQWNDGKGFEPIGSSNDTFDGTLDGKGYEITELHINCSNSLFVGLFGHVGEDGLIKNIGIFDAEIVGRGRSLIGAIGGLVGKSQGAISNSYVVGNISLEDEYNLTGAMGKTGGLIGFSTETSTIDNSYTEGVVNGISYVGGVVGMGHGTAFHNIYSQSTVNGQDYVGGLVGYTFAGKITDSHATGFVNGISRVGGLVGHNIAYIYNSYASGDVGGRSRVGGLLGMNRASILNIYANGDVVGNNYVGGLIGENRGTVLNSYSVGKVDGNGNTGGLIGNNAGTVENSFWDVETSGQETSNGGTGKTTVDMKDVTTYTDTDTEGLDEPWDFVDDPYDDEGDDDIWAIDDSRRVNEGYPYFSWDDEDEERTRPFAYIWVILAAAILSVVYFICWYRRKDVKKIKDEEEEL